MCIFMDWNFPQFNAIESFRLIKWLSLLLYTKATLSRCKSIKHSMDAEGINWIRISKIMNKYLAFYVDGTVITITFSAKKEQKMDGVECLYKNNKKV